MFLRLTNYVQEGMRIGLLFIRVEQVILETSLILINLFEVFEVEVLSIKTKDCIKQHLYMFFVYISKQAISSEQFSNLTKQDCYRMYINDHSEHTIMSSSC